MNSTDARLEIAKLNSHNYYVGKFKLEMLLTCDNLWEAVNQPPPSSDTPEWTKRNRNAMATISLLVEDDNLIHIRSCTNARDMWQALKGTYERPSLNNKLYLLRKMYKSKFENGQDMGAYVNGILEIVEQLRGLGETLQDSHIAALMLSGLPDTYGPLITTIEGRSDGDLSLDYVKMRLIDEFKRRKENAHSNNSDNRALRTEDESRNKREPKVCYYCGKKGHFKRDCRQLKSRMGQNHRAKAVTAEQNEATGTQNEFDDHICFHSDSDKITDGWFIDSGATSHMTSNRELFNKIQMFEKPAEVHVADGRSIQAMGQGSGYLYNNLTTGPTKILLNDVLYVPALEGNLLSVKKLAQLGYGVAFEGSICRIAKNGINIITANLDGNLYKLNYSHQAHLIQQKQHLNCIHTWHRRMGHRDPQSIWKLARENLALNLKISSCPIIKGCEECIKGKMVTKPFPKQSPHRSSRPYTLLHSDIAGPMKTITPGGNRYLATITDDYSRYTEIFLLKTKDQMNDKIAEYIKKWNNHFGRKPCIFRSDGGGEFVNTELDNFLKNNGIRRQTTTPYSPQQNGVSERKNRTIMEMTRCMLLDSGLSNTYWGEAANTATYLYNRIPNSACALTPYEMWFGEKPNLSHIRIFGSKAHAKLPNEKLGKLDIRTITGIMVGYSDTSKAYRILNPLTGKIIISRSVVFDEGQNTQEKCDTQDKPQETPGPTTVIIQADVPMVKDDAENSQQQLRRSSRPNKGIPAERLTYMALSPPEVEPETWSDIEKMNKREKQNWIDAINEELKSFEENKVWTLTQLPANKKAIGCRWTFKLKRDFNGQIGRYKARLVAKGYSQRPGHDYTDTFAPVVRYSTIRTLLTIAASRKMHTRHLDVKCAFLNGELTEEIYLEQPTGPNEHKDGNLVYKLNRAVYGLKQSANVWNKKINDTLTGMGYRRGKADQCLYTKEKNGNMIYILIYVDDLLICGDTQEGMTTIQQTLQGKFKMQDLGEVKHYLGIQINRPDSMTFHINQSNKIYTLLHDNHLEESKVAHTPMECDFLRARDEHDKPLPDSNRYRQAVGALLYLATITRPDISASTGFLGRRVSHPSQSDWSAAKRLLKYLKNTADFGITLEGDKDLILKCYSDADWAGDGMDRKSTTGYVFLLGKSPISWCSKKQTCTAQSSTEAEYVAASSSCQELQWLKLLLSDFDYPQTHPIVVHEDNQGCIKLAESDKFHPRTKHIDVKFHIIRDLIKQETIKLQYCPTELMLADIFTKPLARNKFEDLRSQLGVKAYLLSGGVRDTTDTP